MIDDAATAVRGKVQGPRDQRFVLALPHRLRAAAAVSADELQAIVLLQRIYLRLLAIELGLEAPRVADRWATLESELARQDRRSRFVMQQLRDGERAMLQLWISYFEEQPT